MKVRDLFIYPIKGLPGCRVASAEMDQTGFTSDRRYMLTDSEGRFISQREWPLLSQMQISPDGNLFSIGYQGESLSVSEPSGNMPLVAVTVWSDTVQAIDCGDEAADFFSSCLSASVRLVYMHNGDARLTGGADLYADQPVSFADACPILVVNTASLQLLSEMTGAEMSALRFRPNIVVESNNPWEEDHWKELSIGRSRLDFVKICGRCQVINIDPKTGVSGQEPLRTLSGIRRDGNRVLFGTYYRCMQQGTVIREGDEVSVLKLTQGTISE